MSFDSVDEIINEIKKCSECSGKSFETIDKTGE